MGTQPAGLPVAGHSQGRAGGSVARCQPWQGEAHWDFAEGALGRTGIGCPTPGSVPGTWHAVLDGWSVVPACLPGAQHLVCGFRYPIPANQYPVPSAPNTRWLVCPVPPAQCLVPTEQCPVLMPTAGRSLPGAGALYPLPVPGRCARYPVPMPRTQCRCPVPATQCPAPGPRCWCPISRACCRCPGANAGAPCLVLLPCTTAPCPVCGAGTWCMMPVLAAGASAGAWCTVPAPSARCWCQMLILVLGADAGASCWGWRWMLTPVPVLCAGARC